MVEGIPDMDIYRQQMQGSIKHLEEEFKKMNVGRASPAILQNVAVRLEEKEKDVAVSKLGVVSLRGPSQLQLSLHDPQIAKLVEKAIRNSDNTLDVLWDGKAVMVRVPKPSAETRKEMSKMAAQKAEHAKMAIR